MGDQTPTELSAVNNAAKLSTDIAVMSERIMNMANMLTEMKNSLQAVVSRAEYEQYKKTNDAFHGGTTDKLVSIEKTQAKLHDEIEIQFSRINDSSLESSKDRSAIREDLSNLKSTLKVWFVVGGAAWGVLFTGSFFLLNKFL